MLRVLRLFLHRLAAAKWFMRAGPKFMPQLDRTVHRLTRGRLLSNNPVIPTLILVTTGAKSGLPRSSPLACLPEPEGTLLVVGSNFGQDHHPAWSGNLLKTPRATASFRGKDFPVTATLLTGADREAAWPWLIERWPLFDRYTEVSGRELRVFRLTPTQ